MLWSQESSKKLAKIKKLCLNTTTKQKGEHIESLVL